MFNFFKQLKKGVKATIKYTIVAFVFTAIILSAINTIFRDKIKEISSIINLISVKTTKKIFDEVKIDKKTNTLTSYPSYGTNYGVLKIPSIEVELPIYYGDELEILKYGVGHTAGTYFPGEGGSILYMAHNTANMLRRLPEVNKEDEKIEETSYGTFHYKIDSGKVIKETDMEEVPIQSEKELLMIYTCYPTTAITHTIYRYII